MQEAAGTSLVAILFLALPGTWAHWQLGHIDWTIVLGLTLGVVPATFGGARLALSLDAMRARRLFSGFLLLFGLAFCLRTLHRAVLYGWLS